MLNNVNLLGRLVRDPELKHTQTGTAVCTITLAVDRDFVDENGVREADFIDVVCWRGTAELVSRWFRKGLLVAVTGRLQSRRWQDQYQQNRVSWEVVAQSVYFAERTDQSDAAQRSGRGGRGGDTGAAAARTSGRDARAKVSTTRPVDARNADVDADYEGDLYRLPSSDFAGLDEDEDDPF